MNTTRRSWSTTIAILLALPGGCSLLSSHEMDERAEVGEYLTSWAAEYDVDDDPVLDIELDATLLIEDDTDRDAFLAGVPSGLDTSEVAGADLDESVLVVAEGALCASNRVVVDDDGATLEWQLVHPNALVDCAPVGRIVSVWQVDRDELTDDPSTPLTLAPDGDVLEIDDGYRLCDPSDDTCDPEF